MTRSGRISCHQKNTIPLAEILLWEEVFFRGKAYPKMEPHIITEDSKHGGTCKHAGGKFLSVIGFMTHRNRVVGITLLKNSRERG